jgi:hypothetical protein
MRVGGGWKWLSIVAGFGIISVGPLCSYTKKYITVKENNIHFKQLEIFFQNGFLRTSV